MSDARKIGLEYKAISSNPNVPVAHSKPPDNVENFEELFILCLAVDFSSLDSTQDAVNFLNYRKVAEKSLAARILLKHAKKFTTNRKDFCLESYAFRNLGLFALAIDVCPKKDADCLVKIVDEMCAILVENSSVRAQVVGNMVLSTDVKKGFQIMIGGGESGGFWHSRRNKDAFLICDLKILVLSEMVMSERETTLLFKSPKGLEWLERAHLKKLDPSLIVENTRGLIEDKRWCAANCESYLIALIDLTDIWAAEAGSSFWLLNFFSSDASIDTSIIGIAKDKLLKLFCGETTEMLFFNLSDEDFAKISKAVFKRICEKLMKWNILVYATRAVGEFVITLDESFLAHKVFRTKRSRCLGIVRGMLEHIFLHLFQFSSCLGRTFWSSVDALRELIQEHEAMEANSFFQVRPIDSTYFDHHSRTAFLDKLASH